MNSGNISGGELYWIVTTLLACGGVGSVLLSSLRDYWAAHRAQPPDERLMTIARVAIGQHSGMLIISTTLLLASVLAGALPPNPNPPPSPFPPLVRDAIPLVLGSIPLIIIGLCLLTLWLNNYLAEEYLANQEESALEQPGEVLGDASEVVRE